MQAIAAEHLGARRGVSARRQVMNRAHACRGQCRATAGVAAVPFVTQGRPRCRRQRGGESRFAEALRRRRVRTRCLVRRDNGGGAERRVLSLRAGVRLLLLQHASAARSAAREAGRRRRCVRRRGTAGLEVCTAGAGAQMRQLRVGGQRGEAAERKRR